MENKRPLTHPALTPFDGSLFVWASACGIAYASELNLPVGRPPPAFITIRSHRTGTVKVFSHYDSDAHSAAYTSIDGVTVVIVHHRGEEPVGG